MNIFKDFTSKEILEKNTYSSTILETNGHIHSPYSFSCFANIPQAIEMSVKENIKVLGINDFYSTAGYAEFYNLCKTNKIFPLFNIEFIGLNKIHQEKNIKVNDPNNPGRTYFSGKGLNYPVCMNKNSEQMLSNVRNESMKQIEQMISKLNLFLKEINSDIVIDFNEIKQKYAKDLVRERHIAKVFRIKVFEKHKSEEQRIEFFTKVYSGKLPVAKMNDEAAVEEEIRGMLLKSGGKAFVAEEESAFLPVETIRDIIIDAGGIPCYPVLLDDKNGNFTDYERNKEAMLADLISKNIFSIELIPGRNSFDILKDFVLFFKKNNFVITLGTEHNAPLLFPITVNCRNNVSLDKELKEIAYNGACIIAAHQYLKGKNEIGYIDSNGIANQDNIREYEKLGNSIIKEFIS